MNYLLDSQPLLLIPELAKAIGINEALVLQQVHYWLKKSPNIIDDRQWVYNTIDQWHEQFYFMSLSTLKRTFQSLHEKNILLKNNSFNKMKMDKTNWYSIDYEEFNKIMHPLDQIDPSIGSDCTIPLGQIELMDKVNMNHTITREYTETTTETTTDISVLSKTTPEKKLSKPKKFEPLTALVELGVDPQIAQDWLEIRKAKKAPLTQTALDAVASEAAKASMSVCEAVRTCCTRGWQGFQSKWIDNIGGNGIVKNKQEALEASNRAVVANMVMPKRLGDI